MWLVAAASDIVTLEHIQGQAVSMVEQLILIQARSRTGLRAFGALSMLLASLGCRGNHTKSMWNETFMSGQVSHVQRGIVFSVGTHTRRVGSDKCEL